MEEQTLIPDPNHNLQSTSPQNPNPSLNQNEIIKVMEIVERDSMAIAESYSSLFSSLRFALSEVTSSTVDHMSCFNDASGRLQESALEAATRGNRYINSCLRLNEEMKDIEGLAMQLYPFILCLLFVTVNIGLSIMGFTLHSPCTLYVLSGPRTG
ncbi:hypothetical protein GIB67_022798 [Kingdonia uniflora]|uniref:BLOC-1-related complex subunit 6 C-terminal helix domain-containing protein n=1 Tax=Kingdonia uniflora TaxID=39325 RepID=A0A7J7P6P1_9MAGN|nr:hypothetical protein GIB67_022798 [Kingdonia uniflora]